MSSIYLSIFFASPREPLRQHVTEDDPCPFPCKQERLSSALSAGASRDEHDEKQEILEEAPANTK